MCNVAKHTAKQTQLHWKAVKHVSDFLWAQSTTEFLTLRSNSTDCIGYTDADQTGHIDDRKSTSRYIFQIGGVPVSWKSRKQACVALSTVEPEYMALTSAA